MKNSERLYKKIKNFLKSQAQLNSGFYFYEPKSRYLKIDSELNAAGLRKLIEDELGDYGKQEES